ncbi:hypothetical protein BC937DRAFT_87193 [Endogone sp. FLAS-F59071]|nr:hypothetical protein BC937DRAFT_87193 [Endogone sp. FLAS-F59071]|eukprot:RUS19616.1 hypothetical protein BC937DRAFT_87193 [Endogone sp. FLAS-F59071]
MDVALRELHTVKFVHHSITYKPTSCGTIFKLSYNCLQYAEEIVTKQKTTSEPATRTNNHITSPIPVKPRTGTPVQFSVYPPSPLTITTMDAAGDDDHDSVHSERSAETKSPPPIPPKPSRVQPPPKPPLPPKPSRAAPTLGVGNVPLPPPRRERTSSVSFANVEKGDQDEDNDDNGGGDGDDDDEIEDEIEPRRQSEIIYRRASSPNIIAPTVPLRRPLTVPNSLPASLPPSPTSYDAQSINSTISSISRPSSGQTSQNFAFLSQKSFINVIPEGSIDPTNLVPAQTSTGDSLAPPSSPSAMMNDHVPLIPVPPLLTTHRSLQTKLDAVETKLAEYRGMKRARELPSDSNDRPASSASITEETIDEGIFKYTVTVADTKSTLNRVRTLYMSAATVPTILQFPAHLIAYQLTLIESSIFLEIEPRALMDHTPRHPNPQVVASTDFFNYLTRLIEHSILIPQEATIRAQHIHHWVKVAAKCHELQNYQTLKAIVSALGTPPVQRLKRTWACIPKKSMTRLELLSDLMSETRNYGRYREHMGMVNTSNVNGMSISVMKRETLKKPTVPFLGTFIHDITYLVAAVKSTSVASISSSVTAVNRDSMDTSDRPPSPTLSMASTLTPENDPRVKDLLATMHYYQSGPKYAPVPPSNYIKAAQKTHFRTPSLSSALHRSSANKGRGSFGGSEEEEEGIEAQQQLITHYLLTRAWVSEKIVDELSVLREPPKKPPSTNVTRNSSGGGGSGGSGSGQYTASMVSTTSSAYRVSAGSLSFGTSSGGSGGDSRPNSLEDGMDAVAKASVHLGEDGNPSNTGMVFAPTLEKVEKEGGKEKRGLFSIFSGRTSLEKERPVSAENGTLPQNRRSMAREESITADMILPDSDDEDDPIDPEEYPEADRRVSLSANKEKRQSWKGGAIRVMVDEPPPVPTQSRQMNGASPVSSTSSTTTTSSSTTTTIANPPKPPSVPAERARAATLTSASATIKPFSYMATASANSSSSSVNTVKAPATQMSAPVQSVPPVRHSFDVDYIRPSPPTAALPPPPPLMPKPKNTVLRNSGMDYSGSGGGGNNGGGGISGGEGATNAGAGGVPMPGGEEMRILLAKRMANELAARQS